jgi:hypothetical protein
MKELLAVFSREFSSCFQGLEPHALQWRISPSPGSGCSVTEGYADLRRFFLRRSLSLALTVFVTFHGLGCPTSTRNRNWKKQFTYLKVVENAVQVGAHPPITCPPGSATNNNLDWYQQATCYLRDTAVDPATRMAVRNGIVEEFVTLVNHIYGDFEHDIVADRATVDTGFDAANLGLTAASSATGMSVLATVATGTLGLQHAIANNYFQGQTQLVINAKMQQLRLTQLVLIRQHETLPVDCPVPPAGSSGGVSPTGGAQGQCYSLQQGMNEVQDLFYAGTIHRALQEISNQTGAQMPAAQNQLKSPTTAATAPLSATPASLNFSSQVATGVTSGAAQLITLTNSGSSPITGITPLITGANKGDFAFDSHTANACPPNLASTATCTISVTYAPSTSPPASTRVAALEVSYSSGSTPVAPVPIALNGAASDTVYLTTTSLSLPTVAFPGHSTTALTIANFKTTPLTGLGFAIAGPAAADFTQTNTCPAPAAGLLAGQSCAVTVTFTPAAAGVGARTATMTVTYQIGVNPQAQAVSLNGTGQ